MAYKVFVIPGWSEDKWHIQQMAKFFPPDKLRLASSPDEADIIIAHSSGSYSLPAGKKYKKILLIGPPYGTTSIFIRIFRAVVSDVPAQLGAWGFKRWLAIRAYNVLYALRYPLRHIKIWRSIRKTLAIADRAQKTIVIRNTGDKFCSPGIKKYVEQFPGISYIELDGLHEDCWINPEPYVAMLAEF